MNTDSMAEFKSKQRETWTMGNFGDIAVFTIPMAEPLHWNINLACPPSGRLV